MRFHPTRELEACLISLRCLDGPSRHFHLAKTKCTEWLPKVHRRAMFRLTGACRVSICIWNINYLKMQAYCNTIYISKPGMYTITDSPLALLNSLRRRWREIQSHNITHIYTHTHIYICASYSAEFGGQRSTGLGVPACASWLGPASLKLGNSEATVQRSQGDFGLLKWRFPTLLAIHNDPPMTPQCI